MKPNYTSSIVDTGSQYSVWTKESKSLLEPQRDQTISIKEQSNILIRIYEILSLGRLPIHVPVSQFVFTKELIDVVDADITLMFGLDVLKMKRTFLNSISNQLVHHQDGRTMEFAQKFGDMFLNFPDLKLIKTAKIVFHSIALKMFNLMKRDVYEQASFETMRILSKISDNCDTS